MRKRVAGLGELLWDITIPVDYENIAWEAIPPENKKAGGAPANVVYYASQLGNEAITVSAIGNDREGEALRRMLESEGISFAGVQYDSRQTGKVYILKERSDMIILTCAEKGNFTFSGRAFCTGGRRCFYRGIYLGGHGRTPRMGSAMSGIRSGRLCLFQTRGDASAAPEVKGVVKASYCLFAYEEYTMFPFLCLSRRPTGYCR